MRQVSDGRSVVVNIPASTVVTAGFFYRLDGVLGMAFESVETAAGETAKVALETDFAEYELIASELTAADAFNTIGAVVYWNDATDRFTTTATGNIRFGIVTAPRTTAGTVGTVWVKRTHIE